MPKVLKLQLQHQFFKWIFRTDFLYDWLVWYPCSPRDSQESSPIPQLKTSVLQCSAFFILQTLTSIHDYWKSHSFDYMEFVGKVMCLLLIRCLGVVLTSKEQASFNFMAVVTICSDFGAQENKISHCFHCFPIYLPWSDGARCHEILVFFLFFFFQ